MLRQCFERPEPVVANWGNKREFPLSRVCALPHNADRNSSPNPWLDTESVALVRPVLPYCAKDELNIERRAKPVFRHSEPQLISKRTAAPPDQVNEAAGWQLIPEVRFRPHGCWGGSIASEGQREPRVHRKNGVLPATPSRGFVVAATDGIHSGTTQSRPEQPNCLRTVRVRYQSRVRSAKEAGASSSGTCTTGKSRGRNCCPRLFAVK